MVVDDHPVVRDGLGAMLLRDPEIKVIGEAGDGREAVEKILALKPDVVLLDLRLPVFDGVEVLRRARSGGSTARFIILTTYHDHGLAVDALSSGAQGYLLKDAPREELARAVHAVYQGESFIHPTIAAAIMGEARIQDRRVVNNLSARELEVLRLIAKGAPNKEIASELSISQSTVKTYVERIFQKLEVTARSEAVARAFEKKLITFS